MTTAGFETEHWPTDIKVRRADRRVDIVFDTGETFSLPAELLRVESPSAEVQGHSPSQKQIVPGKRQVGIDRAEPVGHYAVRLVFDDGHDTGIFSWKYLYELGSRQDAIWQRYLDALAERGLSRDPG
ncbi:MAG: DUF971 domain-containing protein [Alphaproteobacteria bacterium]|nr:DUF971 domain-containing protein [Alphaproteobacteria bacterium]